MRRNTRQIEATAGEGGQCSRRDWPVQWISTFKWCDNKVGFGDLNGEYWLGLDKIYRLTSDDNSMLRVDLEDFERNTAYAEYNKFGAVRENDMYKHVQVLRYFCYLSSGRDCYIRTVKLSPGHHAACYLIMSTCRLLLMKSAYNWRVDFVLSWIDAKMKSKILSFTNCICASVSAEVSFVCVPNENVMNNWTNSSEHHSNRMRLIERFHSRGKEPCKFIETEGSVYIRKEFNSHSIGLVHRHGRRFIVLEHQ